MERGEKKNKVIIGWWVLVSVHRICAFRSVDDFVFLFLSVSHKTLYELFARNAPRNANAEEIYIYMMK
jgi:hypothetical protein